MIEISIFSDEFLKFLDRESRFPNEVRKYCHPYKKFGFKARMINEAWRFHSFEAGERKIFSEKQKEIAPIVFASELFVDKVTRIYFSEGESDGLALTSIGLPTIVIPGANTYTCIEKNKDLLKKYIINEDVEFCILFDNDNAGVTGAKELGKILVKNFTKSKVRIFDWGDLDVKDMREAISKNILSAKLINEKLDNTQSLSTETLLLSEIVQPEKLHKCPLDYCVESSSLLWTAKSNDLNVLFLSDDKVRVMKVSEASMKFLDVQNCNSLEMFDVEMLKEVIGIGWRDFEYLSELKEFIGRYVYTTDDNLKFLACYAAMSYLYPVFKHVPYLYLNGSRGSGKSTLSELMAALSFNGEHLSCPTPASVRRTLHKNRGLISIDDAENLANDNEETQTFRSQLNSGYNTRAVTMLCNQENKQEVFYIGGPKIFNSINGLENVLSSRTIFMKMKVAEHFRTPPRSNEIDKKIKEFRSRGMLNALFCHRKISSISNTLVLDSSRESDLIISLLSVAKFFDSLNMTKNVFTNSIHNVFDDSKKLKGDKWSFEMCLLNAVYGIWNDRGRPFEFIVFNSEIKDVLGLYHDGSIPSRDHQLTSKIGEVITQLELSRKIRRSLTSVGRKTTSYEIKVDLMESLYRKSIIN